MSRLVALTAALALALSACVTPATVAASDEPASVAVTLTRNLAERVDAGEWTRGEGLAATLGYLLGHGDEEDLTGGRELIGDDATAVVRIATEYVADGSNPDFLGEVAGLLDELVPTEADLARLSGEEQGAAGADPGEVRLAAWEPQAQDADPRCDELWANSEVTAGLICLEVETVQVQGATVRVYWPVRGAPGVQRQGFVTATREAIERTYDTFAGQSLFSQHPDVALVLDPRLRIPYAQGLIGDVDCAVVMDSRSFRRGTADYQHIVAHELAHCYTFDNLERQFYGPPMEAVQWWAEGGAEFLANVVYPTGNVEYEYLPSLRSIEQRTALVDLEYEAFAFFQHAANVYGPSGLMQRLAALPTVGDREEQIAAFVAWPDSQELLHTYGQGLLDRSITDTGGGMIPTNLRRPRQLTVDSPGPLLISQEVVPLTAARVAVTFAPGRRYTLDAEIGGDLAISSRIGDGDWSPGVPETIDTGSGCDHEHPLLLLVTTTDPVPQVDVQVVDVTDSSGCDGYEVPEEAIAAAFAEMGIGFIWPCPWGGTDDPAWEDRSNVCLVSGPARREGDLHIAKVREIDEFHWFHHAVVMNGPDEVDSASIPNYPTGRSGPWRVREVLTGPEIPERWLEPVDKPSFLPVEQYCVELGSEGSECVASEPLRIPPDS